MKVKELMEVLKDYDPDMEICIKAPTPDYCESYYAEYKFSKDGVYVRCGELTIEVD